MDLRVEVANCPDKIVEFAKISLQNRLYVSGWTLHDWFCDAINRPNKYSTISLAYLDEVPVGVAVVDCFYEAGVFVRKIHRHKGIGTELVKAVCSPTQVPYFCAHDLRSRDFFQGIDANIKITYSF